MPIDRKRVRELAARSNRPRPMDQGGREIASGIAELVAELETEPPGRDWVERLQDQFKHLLHRRLQALRLRRRTRPGKALPSERVNEVRALIVEFLQQTDRLIKGMPGRDVYQGHLGNWFAWIEEEFAHHDLADVWDEIRAKLPDYGVETA